MKRFLFLLFAFALAAPSLRAQTATVLGTITDADLGDVLPGATVRVDGTSLGAASDFNGDYRLEGIEPGTVVLAFQSLGYATLRDTITLAPGEVLRRDVALESEALVGDEVVVVGQLEGQRRAIREQVESNTIVNVVSEDRLRELPDQNAAESIGRLPGVSLQREGGEGTKVQVRGLDPSLTSVTINGERIPGGGGGDFERGGGRAVDLSLISSDLLAGIELFKALTPDKDADAIGGTVNLVVREAPAGLRGRVRALGGYNDLAETFESARLDASASNRFWGDRVGLVATANFQRLPRGYVGSEQEFDGIELRSGEIDRRDETRTRWGGSLTGDVRLPVGTLQLRGLYSASDRDQQRQRLRLRVGETDAERVVVAERDLNDLISTGASGEFALGAVVADFAASFSRSLDRTPEGYDARFRQDDAFSGLASTNFLGRELAQIVDSAGVALDRTYFRSIRRVRTRTVDRDWTASLNLTYPLALGPALLELKGGGKVRLKDRAQNYDRFEVTPSDLEGFARETGLPLLDGRESPLAATFFTSAVSSAGGLPLFERPDRDRILAVDAALDALYARHPFFDQRDYTADERVSAGFGMIQLEVGRLLVAGGVRYEHTRTSYRGQRSDYPTDLQRLLRAQELAAQRDTVAFTITPTSGEQSYGEWFPQVVARYRFADWLDARAAATRTLARPDYLDLVDYENVDEIDFEIERGNPGLRPTLAWNYDAGLTAFNRWGLLGIGAFYKQLEDFQYDRFQTETFESINYLVLQTVNGDQASVLGLETEAQLTFLFLPSPLDGLLVNANYAYTHSEARFPVEYVIGLEPQTFRQVFVQDTRADALPGQASHVANLTVGYEKGGFSGRVSVSYQSSFLVEVAPSEFDPNLLTFRDDPATPNLLDRVYDDPSTPEVEGGPVTLAEIRTGVRTHPFTFVDVQISQRVPQVDGLQIIFNASNLTDQFERERLGERRDSPDVFARGYGLTAQLGVQYRF
jgi:TonB-dependent receptor